MTEKRTSGRRPADAGTPGRQEIWEAIRRKTETFTISDVVSATGAVRKTIHDYLGCLAAGGYVDHSAAAAPGQAAHFRMLRDTGHHAPRLRPDGTPVQQGKASEHLWRSMCVLQRFTYRELMETTPIPIPEGTAKAYCRTLLATGYLRVLRKAEPSKGQIALYALVRKSGPKSPQVQRVKRVFDPNTGQVFMPGDRS